jgi:hypothetical protein
MLYGETVGKLFERFYADQMWDSKVVGLNLLQMVRSTLTRVMIKESEKGGVFDWGESGLKPGNRSVDEVEVEVKETIPRGLRSIRHHSLISLDAEAEVVLDTVVDGFKIGGRADFVMTRIPPHKDLVIVDGKGSRWRGQYVNERQLRWYAMLYWLRYGVIPDRLGFLYWRYDPAESMDWFETTESELEDLLRAVLSTLKEIERDKEEWVELRLQKESDSSVNPERVFWANTGSHCKLCRYLSLCPEGAKAMSKSTKTKIAKDRIRGVEDGGVSF